MSAYNQNKLNSKPQKHRRKLWELKDYLCSIIGTCLTVDDLKKLGKKTKLEINSTLSAYDLHVMFVQNTNESNQTSRLVNKKLNQKFQLAIKQATRIKSPDELLDFWKYSKKHNRLTGAYWAILTHPLTSPSVCYKIHGEIHMLSHLATRQNFNTCQKIKNRTNEIEVLHEALQLAKKQADQEQAWRDEEIAELKMELQNRDKMNTLLKNTLNRLAGFESGEKYNQLEIKNKHLQVELTEKTATCLHFTEEGNKSQKTRQKLIKRLEKLQQQYTAISQENHAMEQMLHKQASPCPTCSTCACKDCPGLNLCGQCVLYVGGQHSLVPHYRQVVENCGGKFIHHDGGKEDHRAKLGKMMSKADAVVCPINCVSHDACLRAKKICKSQTKPFVTMRNAGLSALARGLAKVADNQDNLNNLRTQ